VADKKSDASSCGSYPAPVCSVFEVVDATDDENYFTLGVFLSLADAMREVESRDAPDDLGGDHGDHEEYCVVEIRERKIGLGGIGREVARYEWKSTYDEAADEYGWIRTQNPTGLRCAGLGAHKQDPVVGPKN
jgi:hypothetical protein